VVILGSQLAQAQAGGLLGGWPGDAALSPRLDLSRSPGDFSMDGLSFQASNMYSVPPTALSLGPAAGLGAMEDGVGSTYLQGRMGPLFFLGDVDDLDTGLNVELSYGYQILELLSVELQTGTFWGEDDPVDLWGVPISLNGKVTLPITFLELYGGAGIGGYYVNVDVGGSFDDDDDDFVFGGQLFLGVGVELGPVFVGGELKYIVTDEADIFRDSFNLEGLALMATVAIKF
jgi:hypothetical protein